MLAIMRRLEPGHPFMPDPVDKEIKHGVTTDDTLALSLLRKWTGQEGWSALEKSVVDTLHEFAE
jgi:hypothetical protein